MDPKLESERAILAAEHAELLKNHARLKQAPLDRGHAAAALRQNRKPGATEDE